MSEAKKRIKHISHFDLDGFGATILSKIFIDKKEYEVEFDNISPMKLEDSISELLKSIDNYHMIIITDLSITPSIINLIINSGSMDKFQVFDHHKHNIEIPLPPNVRIKTSLDENNPEETMTCGTELYFLWLSNESEFKDCIDSAEIVGNIRHFVDVVCSYDTFTFWRHINTDDLTKITFADTEARRLNTLFHILDRDTFMSNIITRIEDVTDTEFSFTFENNSKCKNLYTPVQLAIPILIDIEEEKNALYTESRLRRIAKVKFNTNSFTGTRLVKSSYNMGIIFAYKNGPIIGNMACGENPDIDICAIISNNQISFYTIKKDIDVGELAMLFNGGGHKEAAGLTIDNSDIKWIQSEHFLKMMEVAGKIALGTNN